MLKLQRERRAPDRPAEGDTQSCPFCRVGWMQFHEASATDSPSAPGWVCESSQCGYRTLVRRSMKVRARAHEPLKQSERVESKRPRKTR